ELSDVTDSAVLDRSVTYEEEANPSIDEDSQFNLAGINLLGGLANVNLGSGNHPVVGFNVDENTNSVEFDLDISGVLGIGLLNQYVLIVETQNESGGWVRFDDGNNIDEGILELLGLPGTSGTITLENILAGDYSATLVPDTGLSSVSCGNQ